MAFENIEFEKIIGSSQSSTPDSGLDSRQKMDRNFDKVNQSFILIDGNKANKSATYPYIKIGIDITNGIENIESEIGILKIDGSIDASFNSFKTYTFVNDDSANRILYVKSTLDSGNVTKEFISIGIYDNTSGLLLYGCRINGQQIIGIERGQTLKISVKNTNTSIPLSSYSIVNTTDVINNEFNIVDNKLVTINSNLIVKSKLLDIVIGNTDGYYDDNGNLIAFANYKNATYSITSETPRYLIFEGISNGSSTYIARYFDVNNKQIGKQHKGTNGVTLGIDKEVLSYPDGTVEIRLTSKDKSPKLYEGQIIDIEDELSDYTILEGVPETQQGFYHYQTGIFNSFANYNTIVYDIDVNNKYAASANVNGGITSLAVFFDVETDNEGNETLVYLGYQHKGTNGITENIYKEILVPLTNTKKVAICSNKSVPELYQVKVDVVKKQDVKNIVIDLTKPHKGKTFFWAGTSIPATGYPLIVGNILDATVYNEAVGASMARRGKIDQSDGYGWTGLAWQNVTRALSHTIAEKNELINNWNTWKGLLSNNPPSSLTEADKQAILSYSYENKLIAKYLGSEEKRCDYYVFDHGHNDNLSSDTDEQYTSIPVNPYDRNTFIGAMNYLINIILQDNPRAKIIFIGHYENDRPGKERISIAQTNLAKYWNYPLLKLWERLGFTQRTVQTTGYWNNGIWIPSGGAMQTLTLTKIWMEDDLHPYSLEAQQKIANPTAAWFNSEIR